MKLWARYQAELSAAMPGYLGPAAGEFAVCFPTLNIDI